MRARLAEALHPAQGFTVAELADRLRVGHGADVLKQIRRELQRMRKSGQTRWFANQWWSVEREAQPEEESST